MKKDFPKYRFNFNVELANKLRAAINDRQNISLEKEHSDKGTKGTYYAWDRMCAIMDRLEDTLNHINQLELDPSKETRSAFDFYEFINCSYVVINCIKTMGNIFGLNPSFIEEREKSQTVFGKEYSEDGNDGSFFEYIRSLCVVHPLCTNHQKEYLNGKKFHCCPFVTWSKHLALRRFENADLIACIYTSEKGHSTMHLPLRVKQFEKYLKRWIDLIPKVIEAKENYANEVYAQFKKAPLKKLGDFKENIPDYLQYLKAEYEKRWGEGEAYFLDEYTRIFTINLSSENNKEKLEKYKNAILFSLPFLSNAMQSMSFEGYQNTGIQFPTEGSEFGLYDKLHSVEIWNSPLSEYSYNLSKLYHLHPDSAYYDKVYARSLLETPKDLINKFVEFTNTEPDEEVIVLIQLAMYLNALTYNNDLNKNIPNSPLYRETVLSSEDYELLQITPEESPEPNPNAISFEELMKEYGK